MNRLMVPPFPAASRPSYNSTAFVARLLEPKLRLEQLHLQRGFFYRAGRAIHLFGIAVRVQKK